MAEEGADALWPPGEAAHVADDGLLELRLAAREWPGGDRLLDVAVHTLVRVQVGAVGRKVEHLDLASAPGEPVANQPCPMHLQTIENQEHFAPGVAHQALEEAD